MFEKIYRDIIKYDSVGCPYYDLLKGRTLAPVNPVKYLWSKYLEKLDSILKINK